MGCIGDVGFQLCQSCVEHFKKKKRDLNHQMIRDLMLNGRGCFTAPIHW